MNTEIDLLDQIKEWIRSTPENKVRAALASRGVGDTTIRLLLKGEYNSQPGPMLRTAMAEILEASAAS